MDKNSRISRSSGLLTFIFGEHTDQVRSLAPQFLICLALFSFSLVMGYSLGNEIPGDILDQLIGGLPNLEELNIAGIFVFIILNNIFKSLVWMLMGVAGSIPPLFFTALNGFFLGWFSYNVSLEQGLAFTIVALLPHGIIEVPTILLSSAAGMGLGYQVVNRIRGRGQVKPYLVKILRLFLRRIVPLLLLSAIIEVTITPAIAVLFSVNPVV